VEVHCDAMGAKVVQDSVVEQDERTLVEEEEVEEVVVVLAVVVDVICNKGINAVADGVAVVVVRQ